jgi:hypothetical protein
VRPGEQSAHPVARPSSLQRQYRCPAENAPQRVQAPRPALRLHSVLASRDMGAMRSAPDLVELGKDGRGEERFTTRDMIETERRLHHAAKLMAERGAAFFQSRERRTAPAAERHTGGARAQPGGAQPSTGSKGAA